MTTRICKGCGKPFKVTMHNKYYCSLKCRKKNAEYYNRATKPRRKNCKWCGKEFSGFAECCSSACDVKYTAHLLSMNRCRTCEFSFQISGGKVICDYINIFGYSRGCEPYECDKYYRRG